MHVAEQAEYEEYDEEDWEEDESADWQDSARGELEALATELQDIGEPSEYFNEDEIEQLEQATATLALTQEALETVRSARETLKGYQKGAGGKKGGGKGGGRFGGKTGKKGAGQRTTTGDSASIRERKARPRVLAVRSQRPLDRGHWWR